MSADACVLAFEAMANLSWGDPATRPTLVARLFPYDLPVHAEDMAGAQSNCATAACAALRIAEVDGFVRGWRKRAACDPLREPYAGHYDAIGYLGTLGQQRGCLRPLRPGARPPIEAGDVLLIGGDDGLPREQWTRGGAAHVLMVVGVDADGTLRTVEGGQADPGNPKPSPRNCTAIRRRTREVVERPGRGFWLRDAGSTGEGRRIAWVLAAGDLPCVPSAGDPPAGA